MGLVVSMAVFNVLVAYLRGNNTNHTGFGLWLLALVFLPTLLLGGWAGLRGNRRGIGWLACLAGCGGMAFLCYIDYDNILRSYMGEKLCGGYHPDYCLRWEDDTDTYDLMICFGCCEMKFYGPENYLIADIKAEFETLLEKYRDQRPESK